MLPKPKVWVGRATSKDTENCPQEQPGTVSVWVQKYSPLPMLGHILRIGGVTTGLLGAGLFVGISLWLSVVLIFRPHPPRWLMQAVPYFAQGWGGVSVQSMGDIEAELQAQNRTAGDMISLASLSGDRALANLHLLPIFGERSSCKRNCEEVTELRLYDAKGSNWRESNQQRSLQLLDRLIIQGPPEEQVVDPVWRQNEGMFGSTHPLPLRQIKSLQEEDLPGVWLTLNGRWRHQGSPILYGQVLHVDLQTQRINSLLNWSSLTGRLPVWRNLDSADLPELVVNQGSGLEPHYSLYSVANTTAAVAVRLQAIDLRRRNLPETAAPTLYNNALFLAKQGLWSDSLQQFTEFKTQLAGQWSRDLEQQLQLVTFHARASRSQAERDWSSPNQQLLALLLDGQWEAALQELDKPENRAMTTVLPLLKRDSARIWQRITAILQVSPDMKSARMWGALLLLAKEDEEAALKWLTQNRDAPLKKEFEAIANKVRPDPEAIKIAEAEAAAAKAASDKAKAGTEGAGDNELTAQEASASAEATASLNGLFGNARVLTSPNLAAWNVPPNQPELELASGQAWYEITLEAGNRDQSWTRRFSSANGDSPEAIAAFWQTLGFGNRPTLALTSTMSEPTSQTVQVRAVQMQSSSVKLLASGAPAPNGGTWLVATPGQLVSSQRLSGRSLQQVWQENPELSDRLITTLSSHLGLSASSVKSTLQAGTASDLAIVQWVDLTGDQEVEALFKLDPQTWAAANLPFPASDTVSVVLNQQGELLYSTLWDGSATLTGWLNTGTGANALVINEGETYRLLSWSQQQFR